jgi:hypothetical protein
MEEGSEAERKSHRGPMTAWPSSPKSTSNWRLNC